MGARSGNRIPDSLLERPVSLPAWMTPPPESAYIPLPQSFYARDAVVLAKDLIGRFLVHDAAAGRTVGRIVETEAYAGPDDKAAHVYGGRRTDRTEVFWKHGGHAYVYLIYGMHHCFNVVAGKEDEPCAVLVRALEPVEGIGLMEARRGISLDVGDFEHRMKHMANLMNGPGKMCQAMGIDKDLYGHDLSTPPLSLTYGTPPEPGEIESGPRINIEYAEEHAGLPYRFWVRDSPCVSKP